jgi:hypothetical protein
MRTGSSVRSKVGSLVGAATTSVPAAGATALEPSPSDAASSSASTTLTPISLSIESVSSSCSEVNSSDGITLLSSSRVT